MHLPTEKFNIIVFFIIAWLMFENLWWSQFVVSLISMKTACTFFVSMFVSDCGFNFSKTLVLGAW